MSVIVTDRKSIASDSSAIVGGLVYACGPKFRRVVKGKRRAAIAGAGMLADCIVMFDLFEEQFPVDGGRIKLSGDYEFDDEFSGFMVNDKGRLFSLDDHGLFLPNEHPFFAIGSGRSYAMAALALGHSLTQAIEVAVELDAGCNGHTCLLKI